MKRLIKPVAAILIPASLMLSSCKKETFKPTTYDKPKGDSVALYTSVDSDINSVDATVDEALSEDNGNLRIAASCYTVRATADTTAPVPGFEKKYRKFTLTFSGNCDSLTRTGQIIVYKSGSWLTRDYKDSIVFSGYSSDGRTLSGYRSRTFSASSDLKNLVFTFATNVDFNDSAAAGPVHYQASGKKTIQNYLVAFLQTVQITGQGYLIHSNGNQVTFQITKPIVLNAACERKYRFPIEGSISYSNTATSQSRVVDYGSGTCDRLATVSINGGTAVTFKLK